MRILAGIVIGLAVSPCAWGLSLGFSAQAHHCQSNADCQSLGEGYQCVSRKTGCPKDPSESTCVERLCEKKPPKKPSPIAARHQACRQDDDCARVLLGCHCGYCARDGDAENGIVDAVNKAYSKQYQKLSACSKEDLQTCAMAGPCPVLGTSVPVCRDRRCEILFKPRS